MPRALRAARAGFPLRATRPLRAAWYESNYQAVFLAAPSSEASNLITALLAYADSRQTYDTLMKLDFLAVSDIYMTPTAALADVVLPAATHFEFNDIGHYGLGHGFILARPKVVNPPGQCWPDIKILNELGKSITPGKYWHDNWEDLLNDLVSPAGLSYSQFVEKGKTSLA